jgi:hypothetical protein
LPGNAILLLYHWLPDDALDVRITLPPEQKVVGLAGEIVGWAGIAFTVTTTGVDAAEEHPLTVETTV